MRAAGCVEIFEDRISGAEFSRAGLDRALAALDNGGVLVVWELDRLGRSMLDTVKIVLDLDQRGVGFLSKRYVSENVAAGDSVRVEGRLRQNSYDREGEKVYVVELICDNFSRQPKKKAERDADAA
jgi:hypothetical protein